MNTRTSEDLKTILGRTNSPLSPKQLAGSRDDSVENDDHHESKKSLISKSPDPVVNSKNIKAGNTINVQNQKTSSAVKNYFESGLDGK